MIWTETEWQTERWTVRERDRQIRQTEKHGDRQTGREANRDRPTKIKRERDRVHGPALMSDGEG